MNTRPRRGFKNISQEMLYAQKTKTLNFHPNKKILQSDIYQTAKKVCAIFEKNNFDAYIVGGCVRDFILLPMLIPKDIDIATNATVGYVERLFPHCVLVGKSFGVCIVKYETFSFEIATFRKDGPYLDRRHPSTVSTGTLFEDSQRRDFTMNALYYSPAKEKLLDFHGGMRDISKKIVRCVGQSDARIYEDALRILRCIRFSANFKFKIEKSLLVSIKKYEDGLKFIPLERILEEISKVYELKDFAEKFFDYLDINILFKGFIKKSSTDISRSTLTSKILNTFKFSSKSNFFDFFVLFFRYADVIDFEQLKKQLKALPCTVYDSKLCLWFLNLIYLDKLSESGVTGASNAALSFFKELILIERIEKEPNPKIFLILKKILSTKFFVKIITNYIEIKDNFSKPKTIQKLKQNGTPENQLSSMLLSEYFYFVTRHLWKKK